VSKGEKQAIWGEFIERNAALDKPADGGQAADRFAKNANSRK
jgi:hypothetical protein